MPIIAEVSGGGGEPPASIFRTVYTEISLLGNYTVRFCTYRRFERIVVPSSSHLSIPNNIATLMAFQKVLKILSGERIKKEASRTANRLPGLSDPENEVQYAPSQKSVTIFQSTRRQNNPGILIPLMQFE